MEQFFMEIVNRGLSASFLALVVVLLRMCFKRMPKWVRLVLWGFVAVRLLCPVSLETSFSLMPDVNQISQTVGESITKEESEIENSYVPEEEIPSAVNGKDTVTDYANETNPDRKPDYESSFAGNNSAAEVTDTQISSPVTDVEEPLEDGTEAPVETKKEWSLLPTIWLAGLFLMAFYGVVSYLKVRRQVRVSINVKENIYYCDDIATPFVFGLFKPCIYLPSGLEEATAEYVLRHEKEHLRRGDQWWKLFGFALLTVYWFHPLLWMSYILFCKDIEFACDERVIKELGEETRREYAQALLSCSIGKRIVLLCPTAFGENGVKSRIRSVMTYKKATIPVVIGAAVISLLVAAVFLTDRKDAYGIDAEHIAMEGVTLDNDVAEEIAEEIAVLMGEAWKETYQLENFRFTFSKLDSGQEENLLRVSVEADKISLREPEDSPVIAGMKKAQSELTYEAERTYAQTMIDSMLDQLKQEAKVRICEPAIFVSLDERDRYDLLYGDTNHTPLEEYFKKEDVKQEELLGYLSVYQQAGIQPPMEITGSTGYVYSKALENPENSVYHTDVLGFGAMSVDTPALLYYREGVYRSVRKQDEKIVEELPWELLGEEIKGVYSNHGQYWSERDALLECTGEGTLYQVKGYEDSYRVAIVFEQNWRNDHFTGIEFLASGRRPDRYFQTVIGQAVEEEIEPERTTYHLLLCERMNDLWFHTGSEVFVQRMHLENTVSTNGLSKDEELFWNLLAELNAAVWIHPNSGAMPELDGETGQTITFTDAYGMTHSLTLFEEGYVRVKACDTMLTASVDKELCQRVIAQVQVYAAKHVLEKLQISTAEVNGLWDAGRAFCFSDNLVIENLSYLEKEADLDNPEKQAAVEKWDGEHWRVLSRGSWRQVADAVADGNTITVDLSTYWETYGEGVYRIIWNGSSSGTYYYAKEVHLKDKSCIENRCTLAELLEGYVLENVSLLYGVRQKAMSFAEEGKGSLTDFAMKMECVALGENRRTLNAASEYTLCWFVSDNITIKIWKNEGRTPEGRDYSAICQVEGMNRDIYLYSAEGNWQEMLEKQMKWVTPTPAPGDSAYVPTPTPVDISRRTYQTAYEASPYAAYSAEEWLKSGRLEVPFEREELLNAQQMSERYAMGYIPQEALRQASTRDLARVAAFDYTWGTYNIYNQPSHYLKVAKDRFNAFDALFGREDMVEAVLAEYAAAGFYRNNSETEQYKKEAFRQENGLVTLEMILATDEAFDKMNGQQDEVVAAVKQKMEQRASGLYYAETQADGFFAYIREHRYLESKWYDFLLEEYADDEKVMDYLEHACYPSDAHEVYSPKPEDLYVPVSTPAPAVTEDTVIHTLHLPLLGEECRIEAIGKQREDMDYWGIREIRVYAGDKLIQAILMQEAIEADGVDGSIDKGYTECPYPNLTVTLRDVNFDGNLDLEVWGWSPNNSIPYYYWCWNPDNLQFEYAFTLQLTEVDEERKHLISYTKAGGGVYYTERYRVTKENKLELAERMTEEYWANTYENWKEAYLHVIESFPDNMIDPYGFRSDSDWTNPEQYIYLGIHDFTTDGTPELIIGDAASLAVFTYKEGRVVKCIDLTMECCWQCIDEVAFRDNALLTECAGSDGIGYSAVAYRNGKWSTAVHCGNCGEITINGEAATHEEFCRVMPFDPKKYEETISPYGMRWEYGDIVETRENGMYLRDIHTKESVPLNKTFDFESIRWIEN